MTSRILAHAACDILHLGIRAGETVVIHESGQVFATRRVDADLTAMRHCFADGTLVLAYTPRPHLTLT